MAEPHDLGLKLLEYVSSELGAAGWRVEREPGLCQDVRADLAAHRGSRHYLVELKVAREARRPEVEAQLANAMLQSRAYSRPTGYLPLAVVGAPSISDTLAAHLRDYGRRFGEGQAFGFVDGRGRLELFGDGLDGIAINQGPPDSSHAAGQNRPFELFSDANQWLLKVLLAQRLPAHLVSAPRGTIRKIGDLAEMANVSMPTASRLVGQLEEQGFLARTWGRLDLVRVEKLLERWQTANQRSYQEAPARFLLSKGERSAQLAATLSRLAPGEGYAREEEPMACLGLYAACDRLGFGHVQGAPQYLYVHDLSAEILERFRLRVLDPGEQPDVLLRRARWPKAVFRAAIWVEGIPVADVIQCWLDVSSHPLRGAEQARLIWNKALAPYLLERQAHR